LLLELDSELSNLLLEVKKLFLDISSLLILKRENGLLNWSKSLLADFNELSLAVLKLDKEIFLHLNTMFLEKQNGLFHGLDLFKCAILDHLDVSEVSHDLHENFLLTLGFGALRDHLDAVADLIKKLLDDLYLRDGVAEKECCVSFNPLCDSILQFIPKRGDVDSDPANINADLHIFDLLLDAIQIRNLLVKELKVGFLSLDSCKNLLGHPFEGLIFFLLSILINLHVNLFSGVITLFKESCEVLSKSLFPQELKIRILMNEVATCIFNL